MYIEYLLVQLSQNISNIEGNDLFHELEISTSLNYKSMRTTPNAGSQHARFEPVATRRTVRVRCATSRTFSPLFFARCFSPRPDPQPPSRPWNLTAVGRNAVRPLIKRNEHGLFRRGKNKRQSKYVELMRLACVSTLLRKRGALRVALAVDRR